MAGIRLSDDKIRQIAEMRARGDSISEIARELGLYRGTVRKYAAKYVPGGGSLGGPPPSRRPGQVIDHTDVDGTVDVLKMDRPAGPEELARLCGLDPRIWIPQHFRANTWQGPYTTMVDGEKVARKIQLYQSKASFKRIITEEMQAALLEFVRDNVKPLPKSRPGMRGKISGEPQAVSWGLWDAHLGMYAWASEVGEDIDLSIAANRVMNSIDDMVEELGRYPIEKVWMPIGNDFMHFDSVKHTTTKGDHFLDTDTRYAKVFLEALRCLSYMVERALEITDRVELIYVPGNHDYTSSFCLVAALAQRFLNDDRVVADLGANPRKYVTHGGVILGYAHGQDCQPNQLHLIFAQEAKGHWTNSTYREVQIGHRHQRWQRQYDGVVPTNGVLIRMNPALCNVDSWHHSKGLIGEPLKSVEAWRYDRVGYRGSHVVWARDEPDPSRRKTQM